VVNAIVDALVEHLEMLAERIWRAIEEGKQLRRSRRL